MFGPDDLIPVEANTLPREMEGGGGEGHLIVRSCTVWGGERGVPEVLLKCVRCDQSHGPAVPPTFLLFCPVRV